MNTDDYGTNPGDLGDLDPVTNEAESESLTTTEQPSAISVTGEGDMVIGGFAFTPTALMPADPNNPPDFESWDQAGVFLRYIHTGTQFWLGDWLNYGESNYGERYAQAVEHTGYELHTLQTYAWVARQVPRSNRLEAVPFGHYANGIAALPPDQQAQWAKKVADENLTQSELRNQLTEARAEKQQKPTDLWLVVLCKNQADFDKLEKQMRAQGREVTSRVTVRKPPKAEKKTKAGKTAKAAATVTQQPVMAATVNVSNEAPKASSANKKSNDEIRDQFWIAPEPNETPEQKKKRLKKINNARFRARAKGQ